MPGYEDIENTLDLLDALEALQEATEGTRLIPWEDLLENVKQSRQADVL